MAAGREAGERPETNDDRLGRPVGIHERVEVWLRKEELEEGEEIEGDQSQEIRTDEIAHAVPQIDGQADRESAADDHRGAVRHIRSPGAFEQAAGDDQAREHDDGSGRIGLRRSWLRGRAGRCRLRGRSGRDAALAD